jgi:hypothetical protein
MDPVGFGWRLVLNPAHERKGGQVKHASDIFPTALADLLAIGEKARQQRETRARDTMQRDTRKADDRETIRVSRKRARQMTLPLTK